MTLAYRGDGTDRPTSVPLPPARPAMVQNLRLRKHWRYVGFWSPDVLICAARVGVGPLVQEFWGVHDRSRGRLTEHSRLVAGRVHVPVGAVTVRDRATRIDLVLDEGPSSAFEVVTPVGRRGWTWTRKQVVPAYGTVRLADSELTVDGIALIDDNDGYHPRRTHWWWCGGTGELTDGRQHTWSVIVGLNDTAPIYENTLWLDGTPHPLGPVTFSPDLSWVRFDDGSELRFSAEAERASRVDFFIIRSAYRQPFGTFTGTLPGGMALRAGWGVMEDHRALW